MTALASNETPRMGDLLRQWRQRRHLSQLALAADAEVSQKHLSFLEGGRAKPSREMVLRLAEVLDIPLRERNHLLLAGGFAPVYPERPLDDPAMAPALDAVQAVLDAHAPWPALAVDRRWTLIAANTGVTPFLSLVSPALREPPVNVIRLSLHPDGLAPHIVNLGDWRAHILDRLAREFRQSHDAALGALLAECRALPGPLRPAPASSAIALPLRLRFGGQVLSFLTTTTVFGTAAEITLSELTLETFFPADPATRNAFSR